MKDSMIMNGWTDREVKAAEEEAKRSGTTSDKVAKTALERHRRMSSKGSLYRAKIV